MRKLEELIEQTPEERATASMVVNWWNVDKKAFADRKQTMELCYDYYQGKHYTSAQKKSKKRVYSSRNYIFTTVQDALALLTDNKPSIKVWPREDGDVQLADKMQDVLAWVWDMTKMDTKLPMATLDSLIYGVGWLKVYFDSEKDYPRGDIAIDIVHPYFLVPDPDATNMDTAKRVTQFTPTPLWMIRRDYPEKGHLVQADDSISMEVDSSNTIPSDTNKEVDGLGAMDDAKHSRAWLLECWLRDDATLDKDELGEEGEILRKKGSLKYPGGRKIVVAGNVLLEDGPNPFEDGRFPYVMISDYEQSGQFWPFGDVEFLIETNIDINKIVSRLNDWIRTSANTVTVYDDQCNIKEDSLSNIEGVVIKKSKAGDFNRFPPPPLPDTFFKWLLECKSDLEVISGIREVLQGRDPSAGSSGVAFERLQEFALSRVRKKARNIDNAIIELGELIISRVKQFYNTTRQIRITGDFPVFAEPQQQLGMGGDMGMGMMGTPPMMPGMGGGMDGMMQQPGMGMMQQQPQPIGFKPYRFLEINNQEFIKQTEDGITEAKLDVTLDSGTSINVTKSRERQEALDLFKAGVIDAEEVAKRYDIRNYQEIKQRMEQEQQRQMMMQMQQQQQALMSEV